MPFLNVDDRLTLVDFLDSVLDYVPEAERAEALAFMNRSRDEALVSQDELLDQAKRQAFLSWSARRAIQRYVEGEGAEVEWGALLETTRPTTAYLLRKLRDRVGTRTLSDLLDHAESATALQGEERTEVELVRPEIWANLWQAQPDELQTHATEAKKEFDAVYQRLQKLRQFSATASQRKQLEQKIADFEDRIYFGGEFIPLETLDEELKLTIGDVLGQ